MKIPALSSLPPIPDTAGDREAIAGFLRDGAPKLVVLDDDPTGTQTVHGIDVLAEWSVESLTASLEDPRAAFFILTNTRSMALAEAVALNREIAANLNEASRRSGRAFTIASRGDSTLRGHYPGETDALAAALPCADGILLVPAFIEGGRFTIDGVHFLRDGDRLVPVGETEFARDAAFGYRHSRLAEWVEEKTGGRVPSSAVASIGIGLLRQGGAAAVERALLGFQAGATIAVDAAEYADLEVFVHGLMRVEREGRRHLARTGASFVRVRAGIGPRAPLSAGEIAAPGRGRGLVVVGSYVSRTTTQLERTLKVGNVTGVELDVDLLRNEAAREREVARVAGSAESILRRGGTAVVFTSRRRTSALGRAGELGAAQAVSGSLVEIVRRIRERPRFLIAKGGITSSDLAVKGLGMRRALVLGQAAPGVPVWRTGAETTFPGIAYVVFPGNVGGPDSLRELVERLNP